ncbi:hypothetical protein KUTeg_008145 [Tegillarca granosa]|uniref:Uncharacterized protein n=1 Tax=Tegillarca granosa TaxID=220873 RepID=A0ABQ9F8A0_TEGGR|nr:hypothetical protein KUTeg_008145 [Tegillarca granosa]
MTGRVVIVTGANSGIGFEVARHLCEGGNDVVLACRSEEKGKAAVEKILAQNPNALATFMQLDLEDLSSVRKFVEDFHSTGKELHVLVNNAGMSYAFKDKTRRFTKDNFEMTMGINHLGPFLLTHLLLDDLKKTAEEGEDGEARIINVTSSMHDLSVRTNRSNNVQPLDMENFFLDKPSTYSGIQAYKNSKLAQILFTYELARKLEGSKVTVNCVCPGFIPKTGLVRHNSSATRFMVRHVLNPVFKVMKITRSLDQGSKAVVDVATNDKLKGVSGKYFSDMQEKTSSEESLKDDLQKSLYKLSARYCHLDGYEPLDAPEPPPPEEVVKTKSKKGKANKDEKQEAGASGEGEEDKGESSKDEAEAKVEDNKEIKFIDEDEKQVEKENQEKTEEVTEKNDEKKTDSVEDSGKEQTETVEEPVKEIKEKVEEEIKKVDVDTPIQQVPEIAAQ